MQDLIAVYRELARRCDYPLHLGLTEAGMGSKGIVASTAAMAVLLQQGIGDTIRVSLTPEPNGDRTREVHRRAGDPADDGPALVRADGHRLPGLRPHDQHRASRSSPSRSRPTCARRCRRGARAIPASRTMQVAVMGCVVNGPGESKLANIGISLPGTGETPVAPVYVDGEKTVTLKGDAHRRGIPAHRRRLRARDLRRRSRAPRTSTPERKTIAVKAIA